MAADGAMAEGRMGCGGQARGARGQPRRPHCPGARQQLQLLQAGVWKFCVPQVVGWRGRCALGKSSVFCCKPLTKAASHPHPLTYCLLLWQCEQVWLCGQRWPAIPLALHPSPTCDPQLLPPSPSSHHRPCLHPRSPSASTTCGPTCPARAQPLRSHTKRRVGLRSPTTLPCRRTCHWMRPAPRQQRRRARP